MTRHDEHMHPLHMILLQIHIHKSVVHSIKKVCQLFETLAEVEMMLLCCEAKVTGI